MAKTSDADTSSNEAIPTLLLPHSLPPRTSPSHVMRDLTEGPLLRHVLVMAAPIAVGMSVQTMHYLVDLYFVSSLGEDALAGASTAGIVFFLIMALTQTLAVGTLSLVSQAVGRKDRERANLVFNQAVLLAAVLAAVTLICGYLGPAGLYVAAVGADAATVAAGQTYLAWLVPAMAIQFALTAMSAALQGTGIVKPTMVAQMLTVILNIILTPILVAGWVTGRPWGIAGASAATSLAAAFGLLVMAAYFYKLERYVVVDPRQWGPRPAVLRRMLAVGLPSGGELGLMFSYAVVVYAVIRGFGSTAQAGFGAGMRVTQSLFLPSMAIAFALPAIAGQNFGAGHAERVRASFRTAAMLTLAVMATVTLLCRWHPDWLVRPFAASPEVGEVATQFISIIAFNFVATGLIFCCSGMFQGLGNTLPSLAATATRLLTFVVPAFWLAGRPGFRIEQIWYLSVATVWLQLLLSYTLLRRYMRHRLRTSVPDHLR